MPSGASRNVRPTLSRFGHPAAPAVALGALAAALGGLGVGAAVPAQAGEDPARPIIEVTGGPSCRPGGMTVQVTAGTAAWSVVLASTRSPGGEARADVGAGQTVVLRSGDVAWGETIDARVELTARDGSSYVDELEDYTFTRPAEDDCAAITAPPGPATVPPIDSPSPGSAQPPAATTGATPTPSVPPGSAPTPPAAPTASGPAGTNAAGVAAGGVVMVTASGFAGGEQVSLRLADGSELGTYAADSAGLVSVRVRIPGGTATGATTLEAVGTDTATTVTVDLLITAASSPAPAAGTGAWPWVIGGGALVALLALVARSGLRRRPRTG